MSALAITLAAGHGSTDTQATTARSAQLPDRAMFASDVDPAHPILSPPGQGTTPPQAARSSKPKARTPAGAHTDDDGQSPAATQSYSALAVPNPSGQPSAIRSAKSYEGTLLADPTLALAADVLDDLERVKIANQNRLRALTRDVAGIDGEMRGFGLDESHPDVARLAALVTLLEKAEHEAVLNLQRAMRGHPLGPWVKAQRGVGEKQAARLLAKIGDPYINLNTGRPRTVSALWAYCGLHVLLAGHSPAGAQSTNAGGDSSPAGGDLGHPNPDPLTSAAGVAPRRQKGQKANWSTDAKSRAWLIVSSCMKQLDAACRSDTGIAQHVDGCACSPYRVAVDRRRAHTTETHPEWSPGHSLNDGMRVASKALLRDLWREARRIHEGDSS